MIFKQISPYRQFLVRLAIVALLVVPLIIFFDLLYQLTDSPYTNNSISRTEVRDAYHYYYSAASAKKIALTFDDGPTPKYTREIARILKEKNAPAAFFFIGEHVLAHPRVVRDVAAMGFTIGNHSFTHAWSVHNSEERLAHELSATSYLIELTTGSVPHYYRPPYLVGIGIDPAPNPFIPPIPSVSWSVDQGYLPMGSDIDPKDWTAKDSRAVVQAMLDDSHWKDSHIALFHDAKVTVEALPEIIDSLRARGYEIVSLDELLTPPDHVLLPATLSLGDTDQGTNGGVSALQWFLYKHGDLDGYALSGIFDQRTAEALGKFQIASGIVSAANLDPAVFGIADEWTRVMIEASGPRVYPAIATTGSPSSVSHDFGFFRKELESRFLGFISFVIHTAGVCVFLALALVLVRLYFLVAFLVVGVMRRAHGQYKQHDLSLSQGVSVVIPAWNEEENIGATIRSVIANRKVVKEIIIVDDGSTDRTALIARTIAAEHPREAITVVSITNKGKAAALNTGIMHARGDIIVAMDADTIFSPTALESLVVHFVDPSVGAVAGKVYTTHLASFLDRIQALEYMLGQNIDKRALAAVNAIGVIPGPIGAWRRTDILAAGGFSGNTLVEDQDMTLALLRKGRRIVYEPHAVAYTETPLTLGGFLKQRFRWVYGTMQCFWKHKAGLASFLKMKPGASIALINILFFHTLLPLLYPIVDLVLLVGLLTGSFGLTFLSAVLFTIFDCVYAYMGTRKEAQQGELLLMIPIARLVYRQLIYYTVVKSIVRALEGTGLGWHKVTKTGQAERLYEVSFTERVSGAIAN